MFMSSLKAFVDGQISLNKSFFKPRMR